MSGLKFGFKLHIIDDSLPAVAGWAQTALVGLDGDGELEYIVGRRFGEIYWYDYDSADRWKRHLLGEFSPSDVSGCAMDVDGDDFIDFVTGGVWYRNLGGSNRPFERIVFDPSLDSIHDITTADIDGEKEVLTMSDRNDLRWYDIPEDSRKPWIPRTIGSAVHAGLAVGDIDEDGALDVMRSNVWFENVRRMA